MWLSVHIEGRQSVRFEAADAGPLIRQLFTALQANIEGEPDSLLELNLGNQSLSLPRTRLLAIYTEYPVDIENLLTEESYRADPFNENLPVSRVFEMPDDLPTPPKLAMVVCIRNEERFLDSNHPKYNILLRPLLGTPLFWLLYLVPSLCA